MANALPFTPMQSEERYLIACYKHKSLDGMVLWWGPNRCGYFTDLAMAGLYSKDEAERITASEHHEAVAVPETALVGCRRRIVIDPGDSANQWLHTARKALAHLTECHSQGDK